ncbi:hypothetical protein ABB37_08574 [Leptomonas pyrrhocoris]|uniref:Uncharacterized protein n=1 Tax=Leptomonas pyrrhocoris TaxID=157538 RepID=A0A0M9FSR5_LEPPY|nr:hypothetical protein ABB37_08574 [Leptomonas pyrrhocoris]KPA75273.1 hypothetical protein ABB37_08574 [Leptomonas pyrrhocoris]|eukprot:XP_015653712.1 hypothetical protein ABB37_08574 [Leptomonas pyrrhocoris]
MLSPPSFAGAAEHSSDDHNIAIAAAASGTSDNLTLPVIVHYLRHARLPCRRVPGPPIVSSAASSAAATASGATSASQDSRNASVTRPFAGPSESPPPTEAAPTATSASPAGASTCTPSHPQAGKAETPLHAAQQFLASSGASLMSLANSSFYLTLRSTLDGGHTAASGGGVEELADAAEENLLTSSSATAALKERFNSGNGSSVGGIDWKKLVYVRQQCRYTGEALVSPPQSSSTDATGNGVDTKDLRPTTAAASSTAEAEKSVGARFMQSLLHPFIPAASSATAAANGCSGDSPERNSAVKRMSDASLTVPHGEGVMTYVLYAMPKSDYSPVPTVPASTANKAVEKDAPSVAPSALPFLPPTLIPTEFCPALSELDHHPAADAAASSATDQPDPAKLLLLSLVVYEGAFLHGQRHGRGRLTVYSRFVLECTWVHDIPCVDIPRQVASSSSQSSTDGSALAPPTLRRIHAHVCDSAGTTGNLADARGINRSGGASLSWSIRTSQVYMGSLVLTALATKRLLAKLEDAGHAAPSPPLTVMEVHGAHYARLALPPLSTPSSQGCDFVAASHAFSGLAWANHVVPLPDGFGEAQYFHERDAPLSPPPSLVCPAFGLFHPRLWVPESRRLPRPQQQLHHTSLSSSALDAALCSLYCGEWVSGLPHGFGVELERVTDPTCAPLAVSCTAAGAGPPQYPWRTLFLGQRVRGARCGPGTFHGLQGSEATEVVVCGTWPRTALLANSSGGSASSHGSPTPQQESANVVLLPPSPSRGRGRGASSSSSFVTLQGARWVEEEEDGGGGRVGGHGSHMNSCSSNYSGGGGGIFPSATLGQSPNALSGMWEPLFGAVDSAVSQPAAPLLLLRGSDGTDDAASASSSSLILFSRDAMWQQARRVMDRLTQSPECVSALRGFRACFACIYGCDAAAVAATGGEFVAGAGSNDDGAHQSATTSSSPSHSSNTDGRTTEDKGGKAVGTAGSMKEMLARLQKATAAAPATGDLAFGYPWCPLHSWCGMARLTAPSADAEGELCHFAASSSLLQREQHNCHTGCLHTPLSNGATHRQPTAARATTPIIGKMRDACCAPRRPPLSAVAAALEPHAAANTFAHAMHAAAAMVSSLRLRLLSCFAAYPDLCEIVMSHSAHDDGILAYCWDVVFDYVGPVLYEKATAVAVADVRMVWDLLGLDRVGFSGPQKNDGKDAAADAAVTPEVTVRSGWQPEGKEMLRDYLVAVRRCRALGKSDVVDTLFAFPNAREEEEVAEADEFQQCLTSLEACLGPPSPVAASVTSGRRPSLQVIMDALQRLHVLLYGPVASESTGDGGQGGQGGVQVTPHEAANAAAQRQLFTPSQREALLRWLLLAASDPSSHTSSTPRRSAARTAQHQGQPFALLLIAAYVLDCRITPPYPVRRLPGPDQTSECVKPEDLLRLLKELGYAARQLLHTFPSIRAQTFARPLVYPLDALFLKLEYVLSPCAMYFSLSSPPTVPAVFDLPTSPSPPKQSPPPPFSEAALQATTTTTASGVTCDCAKGVVVRVELDQLPVDVLQWCNEALTDEVTESLLQRRLHFYWSRWTVATPPLANSADKAEEGLKRDPPAPPSPLVRWVLGCLRSALNGPGRQVAPRQSEPLPSLLPPPSSGGDCIYTWKKFINAVFFTQEEKKEWATAAATATAVVSPLSRSDYVYLVALAYALRELSGADLSFAAQFVRQDEEEEDEEGEEAGTTTAAEYDESIVGISADEGSHRRPRKSRLRSTESRKGRKKNIFLSSSSSTSSSSALADSPMMASPAASPPVEPHASLPPESAAETAQRTPSSVGFHTPSLTSSPLPPHSDFSASVVARNTSSHGVVGRVHRVKRGPSAVLSESAAAAVVPLGKEWTLTVRVRQEEKAESQEVALQPRVFAHGLLGEVMERVCALVEHRIQERKPVPATVESEPHQLKARPR